MAAGMEILPSYTAEPPKLRTESKPKKIVMKPVEVGPKLGINLSYARHFMYYLLKYRKRAFVRVHFYKSGYW